MRLNWRRGINRLIFVISVIVGVAVAYMNGHETTAYRRGAGKDFNLEYFIIGLLVFIPVIWGCLLLLKVAAFWIWDGFTKPANIGDSL